MKLLIPVSDGLVFLWEIKLPYNFVVISCDNLEKWSEGNAII
jgi:hypothetical protein